MEANDPVLMSRSTALLLVALLGCESPFASEDATPAMLEYPGHTASLTAPAEVAQGASFDLVFTTYLLGCVTTETRVGHFGREVRIWAVERHFSDVLVADCLDEVRASENRLTLKMSHEGIGFIRVFGRRGRSEEPIVLQHTVTVTDR